MHKYLGYHGTDNISADSICSGQKFRPSRKEDEWLGEGVYFFTEKYDAEWWCKNNKNFIDYCVLAADIEGRTVIDLTRVEDTLEFKKFCLVVMNKSERMANGKNRANYMSLALKIMVKKINPDIIIADFNKNREFWTEGLSKNRRQEFIYKFPIVLSQTQICVRRSECIANIRKCV